MHLAIWLSTATKELADKKIPTAALDARLMLEHVLGLTREEILLRTEFPVTEFQRDTLDEMLQARMERKPMAHILGTREFYGLSFMVTKDTLDPRPDSETLIDIALTHFADKQARLRILDIGTGTGCLLLTLLSYFKNAKGVGIDCSSNALLVARENAARHGLEGRTQFVESNWLQKITPLNKYDLIISNPPYIPTDDIQHLEPEVSEYEPWLALDGGTSGMAPYYHLVPVCKEYLKDEGMLLFECGYNQTETLKSLMFEHGYREITITPDLAGNPRAVWGII